MTMSLEQFVVEKQEYSKIPDEENRKIYNTSRYIEGGCQQHGHVVIGESKPCCHLWDPYYYDDYELSDDFWS